ncbi:MAG: AMP-binding protein [Pseudonocardia sp.]
MDTATLAYRPADTSVPLLELTVGDALRAAAAEAPARTAVVEGAVDPAERRSLTYAELVTSAEQVARALLTRFRPGEHVAVWAGNCLEWISLAYGASMAGLVLVTVNPAYRAVELEYVLRQSRSVGLVHMATFRGVPLSPTVAEVRPGLPDLREVVSLDDWAEFLASADVRIALPDVGPLDDVQIQYTSGTTGSPKGALLHHRGLVNNARFLVRRMGCGAGDVVVWPFPLFHTGGCVIGMLGALAARATLVCMTHFDPVLQLDLIETYRATHTGGVPTMIIAMLAGAPRDLSSLRTVFAAGSPVPVEVARECERRFGVRMSIGFGMTECSPGISVTTLDDPEEVRTGTLGTALPHTEVLIVDPATGEPAAIGAVGELRTRGYHVMHGYFDDPVATAAAIDADGWYHTGDLASMDADGCLRIEGRLTDMIIRAGENIYPREIEDVLYRHPAVAEVAVVGRPDATWGETVAAFVRRAPDTAATDAALHAHCRAHLAAYKAPTTWIFVDTFPLTASGKIRKNVLRESLPDKIIAY